jgi:glycosyltransferase involved in cell wall biosynthesis
VAKILFHTLVFSPDAVSTSYLMTDLARQLAALGNEVTVVTTTPHYNLDPESIERQPLQRRWLGLLYHSSIDGVQVWHIRIPMKGSRLYSRLLDYIYFHLMALLVGTVMTGRQEIIFTPSPPLTMGVIGWLLGRLKRAASVYNVQEIYPDFIINQGIVKNKVLIRLLKRLERFVYQKNTSVVAISPWFRDIIRKRANMNGKLAVIPNFVDTDLFRPFKERSRYTVQYNLGGKFVVLYAGNVGLSQDWESFLYAAKSLAELPIVFLVAGDGVLNGWLKNAVISRGLGNVLILGYQTRESMPELTACADICTIPMKPNTTRDTFPSKIYTIMSSGKSVVAQADPDSELQWLINHAQCGRTVRSGDPELYCEAILQAYQNAHLLQIEGARGRDFVERDYSKRAVAIKYDALIQELIR